MTKFCLSCSIAYTDIAVLSPEFVCGGGVMAVDHITIKNKMADYREINDSFCSIFLNMIAYIK